MNKQIELYQFNPHSVEGEQAILGSVMIDNELWDVACKDLELKDFYNKAHQLIFSIMLLLINNNEPIDIITVSNLLKHKKQLNKIGGLIYLNNLIKNTPNTKNVITYLKIVKDKSILRKIVSINKNVIDYSISNKYAKIADLIDYAENQILSLSKQYNYRDNNLSTSKVLTKAIKRIEKFYQMKSPIPGLSSGFDELDKLTLGFNNSDLIIVAGRPSMGKTSFAINITEHIIINLKKTVLIFSMEMTSGQIIDRMLSSVGKINLRKIRNGLITNNDWARLAHVVSLLSKNNFFIYDSGPFDLFDIKSIARRMHRMHDDLAVIIIDYIQLIKVSGMNNNRVHELAEISRSLKILAKELNLPVIALSQLNRSLEQRDDKRPMMSDIRESGAIEQDADLIIFIYRDELYNKNTKDIGKAEIIISKQRNGPTGEFKLAFLAEFSKFENIKQKIKHDTY